MEAFGLNLDYFDFCTGLRMTNDRFAQLFGRSPRAPESDLTIRHGYCRFGASGNGGSDVAANAQAAELTGMRQLTLAGGVALNCVANGKILRDGRFDRIWIQPAMGDAGDAIGAALCAYHQHLGEPRTVVEGDAMHGSYLGPSLSQAEVETILREAGAVFHTLPDNDVLRETVDALERGEAVGWFQGRMEFGPRALDARSILADPRSSEMQTVLNLKIKFRESFRPFAPSVLREHMGNYFDFDVDSQYMLLVSDVRSELRRSTDDTLFGLERLRQVQSDIPAATHVDYSARIQTVHRETNPRYYELIPDAQCS